MLVNEYKPEFKKMRNLDNVYIWGPRFVMSRTGAQNTKTLSQTINSVPEICREESTVI